MKRIAAMLLVFSLLLCGCGGVTPADPVASVISQPTADELAQYIISKTGRSTDSVKLINDSYESEAMTGYVRGYYGLEAEQWSDCAIYRAEAADDAYEISVFRLTDEADISEVFNCLEEYRRNRQGDFFGYNPSQADLVDKALVSISSDGMYAALFICEDTTAADEAFFERLGMYLPEDYHTDDFDSDNAWDPSADELAQKMIEMGGYTLDALRFVNADYDYESMAGYVQDCYGLMKSEWSECAIYRSKADDIVFEAAVFKLSSLAEPDIVLNSLESYVGAQEGNKSKGVALRSESGVWAAVIFCDDPMSMQDIFYECVENISSQFEEPIYHIELGQLPDYWLPYIDPEIDDMTLWDNTALVSALKSGDDSALDKEGKKLYKAVSKVLTEIISGEMSTLEKEEAVYRWLTENCRYDHRHYEIPNNAPRESYEPYGAIINGKAVCLGYATAFQLFMDVLDIECITVVGGAFESREDHAWNMVKIDGEWYCCDPTWDEGAYGFGHFNKSSDYFAMTGHQWDYEAYPIAVSDNDGNWADELWVTVDPAA